MADRPETHAGRLIQAVAEYLTIITDANKPAGFGIFETQAGETVHSPELFASTKDGQRSLADHRDGWRHVASEKLSDISHLVGLMVTKAGGFNTDARALGDLIRTWATNGFVLLYPSGRGATVVVPETELDKWRHAGMSFLNDKGFGPLRQIESDALATIQPAPATVNATQQQPFIPARTAFPMLGIDGRDSKQASKIMARIRGKAGETLAGEKRGNEWWYEPGSWARIVKLIRLAGGVNQYTDPSPEELARRAAAERAKKVQRIKG